MIPSKKDVIAHKHYFSETSFSLLMRKRIYHILLISSVYDAFTLEEDGRIDEQIFYEYMSLNTCSSGFAIRKQIDLNL